MVARCRPVRSALRTSAASRLLPSRTAGGDDLIEKIVIVHGVMMEKHEPLGLGGMGRVDRILPSAVAPALLGRVFFLRVLGLADIEICAARKFVHFPIELAVVLVVPR